MKILININWNRTNCKLNRLYRGEIMEEEKIILKGIEYAEIQKDNETILTTINNKTNRKINLIFNNSIVTNIFTTFAALFFIYDK